MLRGTELWRHRGKYFLNISYPSLQAMAEMSARDVFSSPEFASPPARIALYVHVPFCRANCYYCHYYKVFNKAEAEVDAYLDALEQEVSLYVTHFGRLSAQSVYIGGGTPSYLNPAQINRLFAILRAAVDFGPGIEISFEVHPEYSDPGRLQALRVCGVNRVSIGVESFDDELLRRENRRHSAADVHAAYARVVECGFQNVNLDLIYGLKGQTIQSWESGLAEIARIRPASTTMYYLRLKIGTAEYKLWKAGREFPHEDEVLLMHAMNFVHMEDELGYHQSPVDWFIRERGFEHTYQDHNWRKSDETALLGLGPSAYSCVNGVQYYNRNDVQRWKAQVASGELAIWKGERLEREERMRRSLMLGLKLGIERDFFQRVYGRDVVDAFPGTFEYLEGHGVLRVSSDRIVLTRLGMLVADEVGQQFYSDAIKARMAQVDPELVSTTWPQFNA